MFAKDSTNYFLIKRNSILHPLRYKVFKFYNYILEECLYGFSFFSLFSRLFLFYFVFLTFSYALFCGRFGLAVAYRCAIRIFEGRIERERDGRIINVASMSFSDYNATKQLR